MSTRAKVIRGLAVLGLGVLILPTRAQTPGDESKRQQRDEARLNVELLEVELNTEKNQLMQNLQSLKNFEFGSFGMGGGMMMGGGGVPDAEEQKKALEAMRSRYEKLRAATLETGKKLSDERRRLAELEGRPGDVDGGGDGDREKSEGRIQAGAGAGAGRKRRGGFVKAGSEYINKKIIERVIKTSNGMVRVELSGGKSTVLRGEAAKEFLELMASECR